MRECFLLLLAISGGVALHVDLPHPYEDYCILQNKTNRYNAANQFQFPWFNLDLDAPPSERWVEISKHYEKQIGELIGVLINLITPIFPDALDIVDLLGADLIHGIPQPYRDEIKSIATTTKVPLGQIVVYNIFYEIFTACTSIVAQDERGNLYHARNLDFGLFMGWDPIIHEWPITQKLRNMIINVNWIKNGQILFKTNNFAGYVGVYNGLKPKKFTITANDRFLKEGGYVGLYRFFTGHYGEGKFMSWLSREALENCNSYAEAKEFLQTTALLAPVYYILGGAKPYEGAIIARSLNGTDLITSMDKTNSVSGWYLLETNYDRNQIPLYLDDRRTPGDHCMQVMTQKNAGFQGIYNVLSSRSNLNKLTAYTVLMEVNTGKFETHPQTCPGDCWPW
ncbi:unnamed protein product [Auanema sp. JU1783]|nr:unnamed protein product [Auanema sp. JU1783]